MNIGVSVKKGNSQLQDMLNQFLATMTEEDFNNLMTNAIAIQPSI